MSPWISFIKMLVDLKKYIYSNHNAWLRVLRKPYFLNHFSRWEVLLLCKTIHYFSPSYFCIESKIFWGNNFTIFFSNPYILYTLFCITNCRKLHWLAFQLETFRVEKKNLLVLFLFFPLQIVYRYFFEIMFN